MAQTLPSDILYPIFSHATRTSTHQFESVVDPSILPPLTFSAVCRSWRATVWSQPSLWNTIIITHKSGGLPLHPSALQYISRWFNNSGNSPLTIKLNIVMHKCYRVLYDLLDLVRSQQERWDVIEIYMEVGYIGFANAVPIVMYCSPGPSLSILELNITTINGSGAPVSLDLSSSNIDNVAATTQLRSVKIDCFSKWLLPKRQDTLHLPSLRELCLQTDIGDKLDSMLDVLSACPNLRRLRVESPRPSLVAAQPRYLAPKALGLAQLTDLEISASERGWGGVLRVLNTISCPALRSFDLSTYHPMTPPDVHAITSFFSLPKLNAYPPLFALRLSFHTGFAEVEFVDPWRTRQDVELLELLSHLSHLEHLCLLEFGLSEEVIRGLTISGTEHDIICPSLSFVEIRQGFGLPKSVVEEMVISRWQYGGRKLRKICIDMPGVKYLEYSERLRACIDEGLVVVD